MTDDPVTIPERLAVAASSKRLMMHPDRRSDADVLLAAAYALGSPCSPCAGTGREGAKLKMGAMRCASCEGRGRAIDRRKTLALAAWRMKVTGDRAELYDVTGRISDELSGRLARGGRRTMNASQRRELVAKVLHWWFNPACTYCEGRRQAVLENAPHLTGEVCFACKGERTRPLAREVPAACVDHAHWVTDQLDALSALVFSDMAPLLAQRMDL